MKRLNLILTAAAILLAAAISHAADRHEIAFTDLSGYKTLKCDFHMHTVFSDGRVWPTANSLSNRSQNTIIAALRTTPRMPPIRWS